MDLASKEIESVFEKIEAEMDKIRKIYQGEEESLAEFLVKTHWNLHHGHLISYDNYVKLRDKLKKDSTANVSETDSEPEYSGRMLLA